MLDTTDKDTVHFGHRTRSNQIDAHLEVSSYGLTFIFPKSWKVVVGEE